MKLFVNVLLIITLLMTIAILLGVCQENIIDIITDNIMIYVPNRAIRCPLGQRKDKYGKCRWIV